MRTAEEKLEEMRKYLVSEKDRSLKRVVEWRKIGDKENEWTEIGGNLALEFALEALKKIREQA